MRTSERLKQDTRSEHRAAESAAFMRSLVQGKASRMDYVAYLQCLSAVHGAIESLASQSAVPAIAAIWDESMRKVELLSQDIEIVSEGEALGSDGAVERALDLSSALQRNIAAEPLRLVGALYVLEGATHGGQALQHRVAENFGLENPEGVAYLRSYGDEQPAAWAAFKRRLDEVVESDADYAEVLAGARVVYAELQDVFERLAETGRDTVYTGNSFNAEAGQHPAPQSDREIRAVLEAAAVAATAVPYVHARYGERGLRFTTSDGAWLATLPGNSQATVFKQVDWLGRLLSIRGIPRVILSLHLRETEKALNRELPQEAAAHQVLSAAAEHLQTQQDAVLDRPTREALANAVAPRGNQDAPLPAFFEELWVSMVADELIDQSGALWDFLKWLEGDSPWPSELASRCRKALQRVGPAMLRQAL